MSSNIFSDGVNVPHRMGTLTSAVYGNISLRYGREPADDATGLDESRTRTVSSSDIAPDIFASRTVVNTRFQARVKHLWHSAFQLLL